MTIGPLLIRTLVPAEAEAQPCPDPRKPWVIATAALASVAVLVDMPVVTMALSGLRAEHGLSFAMAQWLLLLSGLATAALILPSRRLGALYGHWRMLGTGLLVSALGACAAGLSPRIDLLLLARFVQGCGGAVVLPASAALIAVNFSTTERAGAFKAWTLSVGIGAIAATILAGAGIFFGGWRMAFLLPAAAFLLTWAILRLRVPIDFPDLIDRPLDLTGACILLASGGLILFGLTLAGIGIGLPVVAMLIGSGVVGLCLFGFWETGPAAAPMLALSRVSSSGFGLATGSASLAEIGAAGAVFLLPITIMDGGGRSVLVAGLGLGCYLAGQGASRFLAERMHRRFEAPLAVAAGCGAGALALVLLALAVLADVVWLGVLPSMLVLGCATGSASTFALAEARRHVRAAATSDTQTLAIRFAILLAIAGIGAIAALAYRDLIGGLAPAISASPAGADFAAPVADADGFLAQRMTGVRLAFVRATVVCAFVCGIAGLIALLLPRPAAQPARAAGPSQSPIRTLVHSAAAITSEPPSEPKTETRLKPRRQQGVRRVDPPPRKPRMPEQPPGKQTDEFPSPRSRPPVRRIAPPTLHVPSAKRPPRRT